MNIIATFLMDTDEQMKFELYADKAPISVSNFCDLAISGFYNGLTFHRVVKDYVIQGGSETNECMCPSDFKIPGEFKENGYDTGLTHNRGAISMARSEDFDSAGTQFFIVHKDANKLDEKYASFGMMIDGFDVLDKIANSEITGDHFVSKPIINQVIKKITIELNGNILPKVTRI